jgi:glycerophosphoryl diester phosphodiesterase
LFSGQIKKCLVIGHRGAPHEAPENTVAGFDCAVRIGVDMIEFDVRLTRDEIPIVVHSRSLKELVGIKRWVDKLDYGEILRLDGEAMKSGRYRVPYFPTLRSVVAQFLDRVILNIELKPVESCEARLVRKVLRETSVKDDKRIIYSSFSLDVLRELRRLRPHALLGLIFSSRPQHYMRIAGDLQCLSVHPKISLCRPELIRQAHRFGLRVMTWTVNRPAQMRKLIGLGVDGIFTDHPELLLSVRRRAFP